MQSHPDSLGPLSLAMAAGAIIDGRYQIQQMVGKGGMCTVFRAFDLLLKRTIAIKLLHEKYATDNTAVARFEREARAISAIKHPNVIKVYNFGSYRDRPFIIEEFVEGISLDEYLLQHGPLPEQEALSVFLQICDALEHTHAAGIVHRDLKPNNIMLIGDEHTIRLVDFGIARIVKSEDEGPRLTRSGIVLGTARYLSPEQCDGEQGDCRSDIYAFGCLMYETLTGQPLYSASTTYAILHKHTSGQVPALTNLSPQVAHVIQSCVSKDPNERPQSIASIKDKLGLVGTKRPDALMKRVAQEWKKVSAIVSQALRSKPSLAAQEPATLQQDGKTSDDAEAGGQICA